jgi:hypothetical protein
MRPQMFKILFLLSISAICLHGQNEFKMAFPNIYFKLNSTDYAEMPYTVDSCFKYLIKNIKAKGTPQLSIWHDTIEVSQLSKRRIKKFKYDLNKYMYTDKIDILINPISWQTVYEQVKKSPPHKSYLPSLGSMIQIVVIDYSLPSGAKHDRETWQIMK